MSDPLNKVEYVPDYQLIHEIGTIISHVAWPLTILGALLLFRNQIKDLAGRITKVGALGIEAEFSQAIEHVNDVIDEAPSAPIAEGAGEPSVNAPKAPPAEAPVNQVKTPAAKQYPDPSEPWVEDRLFAKAQTLRKVALVSPRAAVIEAWTIIELAMTQRCGGPKTIIAGTQTDNLSSARLKSLIRVSYGWNDDQIAIIDELRRLRNEMAHDGSIDVSVVDAERYIDAAEKIAHLILNSPSNVGYNDNLDQSPYSNWFHKKPYPPRMSPKRNPDS